MSECRIQLYVGSEQSCTAGNSLFKKLTDAAQDAVVDVLSRGEQDDFWGGKRSFHLEQRDFAQK